MGRNLKCSSHTLHRLSFYFLFLLISSSMQQRFVAEGRKITTSSLKQSQAVKDEKAVMRSRIGSRPPRCESRCSSCGHCEAIQVPTNPQIKTGTKSSSSSSNSTVLFSRITYARGDDNSNYKPMSWKCKCGGHIFNP